MSTNKSHIYTLSLTEKILYGILYGVSYTVSLLPFWILYRLSDLCYLIAYYLVRYRRKLVRKNLVDSFPEKDAKEIIKIEKRFYQWLCDYLFETIKLLSISKDEMMRRMEFRGIEKMNSAAAENRSCAVYVGHYCNWEWVTSTQLWMPENMIGTQVYHVLENKVFDKFFLHIRSRWKMVSIPMAEILRRVAQYHRDNQSVGIGYLSDQAPFWNNIHHWTNFLNHDTPVLTGAEKITKRFDDKVVYFDISRPKRGYYVLDVIELADHSKDIPDYEVTEAYFKVLEQSIRRQPEFWLWTHNRWKRTREEYNKLAATGAFNMMPIEENKN